MDLKTYAVHRKLVFDDKLLDYAAKERDIPYAVVADSFQDYLDGISNEAAESLMQDYKQMLGTYVPVTISRDTVTNGYDVSGEIPDSLVDAIRLIHGVDETAIVQDLVKYNLRTIGQECKILDVKLGEAVSRTLLKVQDIPPVETGRSAASEDESLGIVHSAVMDDEMLLSEVDVPDSEVKENLDALSGVFADSEMEEDTDDELALLADTLTDEPGTEDTMTDAVFTEDPEPIMEEPVVDEPEPVEPDAGRDFSAAIRRIYDKFCADLRAYGLDERLGLAF